MLKEYDILGEDENIEHSLISLGITFFITNNRVIIDHSDPTTKTYLIDEIDYNFISLIETETITGKDYRLLGAICIIIGVILIFSGYYFGDVYFNPYTFYIVGILLLIGGIAAYFTKYKTMSKICFHLSGVEKPRLYELEASAMDMQVLLMKINENRTKYRIKTSAIPEIRNEY